MESYVVRILKSELWNFKNVKHGVVKYMNYGCVQKYGEIQKKDIVGIYGQNGTGGLLIIYANQYINDGTISATGARGGSSGSSGGSSGGGSGGGGGGSW